MRNKLDTMLLFTLVCFICFVPCTFRSVLSEEQSLFLKYYKYSKPTVLLLLVLCKLNIWSCRKLWKQSLSLSVLPFLEGLAAGKLWTIMVVRLRKAGKLRERKKCLTKLNLEKCTLKYHARTKYCQWKYQEWKEEESISKGWIEYLFCKNGSGNPSRWKLYVILSSTEKQQCIFREKLSYGGNYN